MYSNSRNKEVKEFCRENRCIYLELSNNIHFEERKLEEEKDFIRIFGGQIEDKSKGNCL